MFRHSSSLLVGSVLRSVRTSQLQPRAAASIYKRTAKPFVASPDQFGPIQAALSENRALSDDEWRGLRTELLSGDGSINSVNIDATILGRCLPDGLLEAGKSYVRFLRASGLEPNLASVGRLLRLYHMGATQGALTDGDREDIVAM